MVKRYLKTRISHDEKFGFFFGLIKYTTYNSVNTPTQTLLDIPLCNE